MVCRPVGTIRHISLGQKGLKRDKRGLLSRAFGTEGKEEKPMKRLCKLKKTLYSYTFCPGFSLGGIYSSVSSNLPVAVFMCRDRRTEGSKTTVQPQSSATALDSLKSPGTFTVPQSFRPKKFHSRLPAASACAASRVCAMTSILGASWRTKLGGIVAAVSVLAAQAGYALDDKPETNPDFMLIVGTLGGLYALFSARDNVVSSEKAGVA